MEKDSMDCDEVSEDACDEVEVTAGVEMAAAGIGVVVSSLWFGSFSPTKNMHIIQV